MVKIAPLEARLADERVSQMSDLLWSRKRKLCRVVGTLAGPTGDCFRLGLVLGRGAILGMHGLVPSARARQNSFVLRYLINARNF
jgi:hypothetical protein